MEGDVARASAPPPSRLRRALDIPDFALRLAFFLIGSALLFVLATKIAIGGALLNVGLILGVFFFAASIRHLVERRPWLQRVFRRQLAFEAYYQQRPPRPFLYYVFYPLMMPYWLINKDARREFVHFRGYTGFTAAVLVVSSAYQYFTLWRPELGPLPFFKTLALSILAEVIVSLSMLMPIATTVVTYHLARRRGRLLALLITTVISVSIMAVAYARKRHATVLISTTTRMELRTKADPARSLEVRRQAIRYAWRAIVHGEGEFEHDQRNEEEVLGAPIDAARAGLEAFYKGDETMCFHLVEFDEVPPKKKKVLVLYGDPSDSSKPIVWLGLRGRGETFTDLTELPPHAMRVMRRTSQR